MALEIFPGNFNYIYLKPTILLLPKEQSLVNNFDMQIFLIDTNFFDRPNIVACATRPFNTNDFLVIILLKVHIVPPNNDIERVQI